MIYRDLFIENASSPLGLLRLVVSSFDFESGDLALIELEQPFEFAYTDLQISPACLIDFEFNKFENDFLGKCVRQSIKVINVLNQVLLNCFQCSYWFW